jgi:putative endonuclease
LSNRRSLLGQEGENTAAEYLRRRGYTILHRNYRTRSGEIDIIARHGKALVFVEVKTRRTSDYGSPAAAVTSRKQQQISRVAEEYLARKNLFDSEARFDVVSVLAPLGEDPIVEIIANAFDLYRYG